MKQHNNDNEELSFITLGAATLNVVRYLESREQKKDSEDESSSAVDEKQRALDQEEFVKRGMERIRLFEERAADGARRQRRK